jgi:micrococcal nuclease
MMGKRRNKFLALVPFLLLFLLCACTAADSDEEYLVTRVVDGDTIIIDMDGTEERVRLIGVDTPESVHPDSEKNVPYGEVAASFAREALEGKRVRIELDAQERDRYGRLLAYVYTGDGMFNETLLSEGHAQLATYPPNVRYVDAFTALQKDARERGVGLWAYNAEDADSAEEGAKRADGESAATDVRDGSAYGARSASGYVGNAKTKKFHLPTCRYVSSIKDAHIMRFAGRADAITEGFAPCKTCNP